MIIKVGGLEPLGPIGVYAYVGYRYHTTTRIRIQTAGLEFGGTGLCSCCVRGVDVSCTKSLTVESYMVIYASNSYTYYYWFSSPTLSFIPDLKPFSANPSHCNLSFSSSGLTT